MKQIVAVLMTALSFSACSAEYNFVIPNPPGSAADVIGRAVADEYHKQTGNSLLLEYAPGADHLIAVSKFKAEPKLAVSLGSTTMHVFNHVYRDSIPYTDADFNFVTFIGWGPSVWYTASNSRYRTISAVMQDLASHNQVFVGADAFSVEVNAISLQQHNASGEYVNIIKYKGSAQTLNDVMGGHVGLGLGSISDIIISNAAAGNIRILATTNDKPIVINGQLIPVASKTLNAPQFNGGFLLAITPGTSLETQVLKSDLQRAVASDAVSKKLLQLNVQVPDSDRSQVLDILTSYREQLRKLK